MIKSTNIKFEEAVRLLTEYMALSDEKSRKPVLFHSIRVGTYLYENNYSQDIVLAGILHDALEWSGINEQVLRDRFGDNVTRLVLANTKDDSIKDSSEKIVELTNRCIRNGEDALIVKTVDIIDSFKFYSKVDNTDELMYCVKNGKTILKFKPDNYTDPVFDILKNWSI